MLCALSFCTLSFCASCFGALFLCGFALRLLCGGVGDRVLLEACVRATSALGRRVRPVVRRLRIGGVHGARVATAPSGPANRQLTAAPCPVGPDTRRKSAP